MAQPTLLENLRKAHIGNYGVILSLLGCLDHGLQAKKLVDRIIDASMLEFFALSSNSNIFHTFHVADQVTNLREDILIHRLKYSLTSMEGEQGENFLQKAVKALEK